MQTVKSPYSQNLGTQLSSFRSHITGADDALLCVVSYSPLSDIASTALHNSAERLGYAAATAYLTVEPADGSSQMLDGPHLLELIEAIDPLGVVATDGLVCQLLSQGYHRPLKLDEVGSLLGRPCCCYASFDAMMQSNQTKQTAWQLLKVLSARM